MTEMARHTTASCLQRHRQRHQVRYDLVRRVPDDRHENANCFGRAKKKSSTRRLHQKGRTILKWIFKAQGVMVVTHMNWLRIGTSGGLL